MHPTGQFAHNPMSYPTLGQSAQQMADVLAIQGTEWEYTEEQQWQMLSDAEKQSLIQANYEHLASGHTAMIDDDDDV